MYLKTMDYVEKDSEVVPTISNRVSATFSHCRGKKIILWLKGMVYNAHRIEIMYNHF